MKRKIKKKADVNLTIVWMILAITGFIILVLFIHHLYSENVSETELCHNTVILRATTPKIGKDFVKLQCKTQKICLSYGLRGGRCEEVYGKNKEVRVIKVRSIEDIEKVIAEKTAECWAMMGEGKVSLFTQFLAETYGVGGVYPTCVICSRIAFDKSIVDSDLYKELQNPEKFNLFDYLANNYVKGKDVTYLEYLTNGGKYILSKDQLESLAREINNAIKTNYEEQQGTTQQEQQSRQEQGEEASEQSNQQQDQHEEKTTKEQTQKNNKENFGYNPELSEETNSEQEIEKPKLEVKEITNKEFPKDIAIVFSQITAPTQFGSLGNIFKTAGIATGGAIVVSGKYAPFLISKEVKSARFLFNPWVLLATTFSLTAQQLNVAFQRTITSVYCSNNLLTTSEGRSGCSSLKIITYDEDSINSMCKNIESIP